ncbi:hypothetical protein V5O48_005988 [Marasmius crinis-equi]|uniref:ARID domain-containing protein n=1 Tax=Marasmius crinis-equi TaxID=585013 RepID=A0ABR3FKZ0_9AGAR
MALLSFHSPQNGLSRQGSGNFGPSFDTSYGQLDGPLQKQMLALSQANQARMNSNSSYTNSGNGTNSASFLGGMQESLPGGPNFQIPPTNSLNTPFLDPAMSHTSNPMNRPGHPPTMQERAQSFLQSLASFMVKQNTPLPPPLTGVPVPNYDPTTSVFSEIEPGSEPGSFRLAGKDVDLFRLWGTVIQRGGSAVITNNNAWSTFLPLFDLPEHYPSADGTSMMPIAQALQQYYTLLLGVFEEFYRKNTLEKQRMQAQAMRQMNGTGQLPTTPNRPGPNPMQQMSRGPLGGVNPNSPSNVSFPQGAPGTPQGVKGPMDSFMEGGASEDSQGLKRKLESEEHDAKRVRQRTESLDAVFPAGSERPGVGSSTSVPSSQTSTMNPQPRVRLEPSRRKIEYVPLAREVETYGGRDLNQIEIEMAQQMRRPLRELADWGTIDIDSLTMSIRSRLSTELSYALTTFTLLSTMKGQQPNTGFPLHNAPDLLEEVLDLLEDLAFEGTEDSFNPSADDQEIITNRTLVNTIIDAESSPFASLERHKTLHNLGLRSKPGTVILAILNIIRNLCVMPDNGSNIARHPRALDIILRVCELSSDTTPRPASAALSLSELVTARKDVLYTLSSIAAFIHLSEDSTSPSKAALRLTRRAFRLIVSYLVDPAEAVTPMGCAQALGGLNPHRPPTPPPMADIALEVFTRLGLPDVNRQVVAKAVSQTSLWSFFVSLVRRLPIVDADFHIIIMNKETWLSYFEKLVMALYALAFLSPPKLKSRMKSDRGVGYTGVMVRLIHKLLIQTNQEVRQHFYIAIRRAIETMKVLDDGADSFDFSEPTVSTLSFGVGYGEIGDGDMEKGTGLLGGRRDMAWDFILTREANHDEQMFSELESLLRVEF